MNRISRHLSRSLIAGVVAMLPIGGLVLTVVYLEDSVAGSWLAEQPFYFPGLGILAMAGIVYLIGLVVSTFLGRWLWKRVDSMLNQLPALGQLYQTLKQILGYGEGKEAIFQKVVLVPSRDVAADEIGLVTNQVAGDKKEPQLVVFLPGSPNPTTGRLLLVDPGVTRPLDMSVNEALKALVSVGKSPIGKSAGQETS